MSSTRQSLTKEALHHPHEEEREMSTSNNFNNGAGDQTVVGDDSISTQPHGGGGRRSVANGNATNIGGPTNGRAHRSSVSGGANDNNDNDNAAIGATYSQPGSTRNNTAATNEYNSLPSSGREIPNHHPRNGGGSQSASTYLSGGGHPNPSNNPRSSQMDDETAMAQAIAKAQDDEAKAKKADEKRAEVRSVIRNLYIIFKYTNVGGLTLNYLKPIPKGTAAAERIRRTQIVSQTTTSRISFLSGNGGADSSSEELSLANPPPLRKSWPASFFIIFLVLMTFGLSAAYAWAYNHTSDHVGDVLYAITEDDRQAFDDAAFKIIMAAFIGAASNALYLAIGDYLTFDRFREALTYELLVRYMSDHTHFYLIHLSRDIDDPAGRLTADIDSLCDKLKMIVFGTPMFTGYVTTTATVVWFTYTLVSEYGWFLMGGTFAFFICSVVVTMIMSYFPTKRTKVQKEALSSFSTAQHYFEAHSEHVAFLRGESAELAAMMSDVKRITVTTRIATLVGLPLNFTTIMFYWGVTFFSAMIPGFAYWWTDEKSLTGYDNLSNAVYCVQALMNTMTTYILLAQEYSQLAAVLQRITEMILAMKYIEEEYVQKKVTTTSDADIYGDDGNETNTTTRAPEAGGYYRIRTVEKEPHSSLEVKDVTLFRPNTQNTEPLIEHLTFSIGNKPDEGSLLIMGPSGVGKSSLLRVIAGLWPAMTTDPVQGGIYHPPVQRRGRGSGGMMFLPQRPYLIQSASLAAQIMYPMTTNEVMTDMQVTALYGEGGAFSAATTPSNLSGRGDRDPLIDGSDRETSGNKGGPSGARPTRSNKKSSKKPSYESNGGSGLIPPSLEGLDEEAIIDLKKEIFALLVKVRLGHVARRYSEADWFGIVKPEVESDDEDEEVAFKARNKSRLSVMPATSLGLVAGAGAVGGGGAGGCGYGSTYRNSVSALSVDAANTARLAGARMTVDMSSCAVPWDSLLSVGEQQRLAIARVLFHRPHIAIVDEATSAMDEDSEVMCLQALKDQGIKMLSVAHRSTVKAFHDRLLLIKAAGGVADEMDNTELPPLLPLANRTKQKITYEVVKIDHGQK